jgi:hypothetical protein
LARVFGYSKTVTKIFASHKAIGRGIKKVWHIFLFVFLQKLCQTFLIILPEESEPVKANGTM